MQGIVEMVHRFFPATTNLRQGQTTWISVAKNEGSSYGKSMSETRMVPVIVSLLAEDEARQRRDGKRLRDLRVVFDLFDHGAHAGGAIRPAH